MWSFTRIVWRSDVWTGIAPRRLHARVSWGFLLLPTNAWQSPNEEWLWVLFFLPFLSHISHFWASGREETFDYNIESQITIQTRVETLVPHLRHVGLTQHRHAGGNTTGLIQKKGWIFRLYLNVTSAYKRPETWCLGRSDAPAAAYGRTLWLVYHALHLRQTPAN